MNTDLKRGSMVYDRAGLKYEFVEPLADGRALCRQIYEADGYDGGTEQYPSDVPTILYAASLSRKPPVAVLSQEVASTAAELEALREQISEAMRGVAQQEREKAERLAALANHPKLARLEDFIAGKITHCVVSKGYGETCEIQTAAEALEYRDEPYRKPDGLKLLSLFGNSNGDLEWRVNQYRDGSGSGWTTIVPTCSYEEAFARAVEMIEAEWTAWRASPENYRWLGNPVAAATKLGIPIPDDARDAHRRDLEAKAQTAVDKAEADLAKANDALALARATGGVL